MTIFVVGMNRGVAVGKRVSAGQVRAIQTLYSLQRAIDNGPDRKIKHEKSS